MTATANDQGHIGEPSETMRPSSDPQSGQTPGHGSAAPDEWRRPGYDAILRIPVSVKIILGTTRMPVAQLMALSRGSVIPLDRKVGDMVDIVVNDRIVARGEVVILDEGTDRFAVAIREVVRGNDD